MTGLSEPRPRWFTPPFGWPIKFRVVVIVPSKRHPLVALNRYPRQVIGFAVRLPDGEPQAHHPTTGVPVGHHRALSIMWAEPARWWKR